MPHVLSYPGVIKRQVCHEFNFFFAIFVAKKLASLTKTKRMLRVKQTARLASRLHWR